MFTDEPITITRRGRRARTYEPAFEALEPRMMLTAPTSPEPLRISSGPSAEIKLTWHTTANEDGYHIYHWAGGLDGTWRILDTVPKDTTTYSAASLPPGTRALKVAAFNSSGTEETMWQAINTSTLLSPDNLFVIRRSSTQIDLTWTNVGGEDGYRIHRVDRSSPQSIELIATLDRDAGTPERGILTYSVSVSPSQVYYFVVEAFDNRGNQVYTNYAFALNGMIAYDTDSAGIHLMIVDDSGQHRLMRLTDQQDYYPTWSPDGSKIAFVRGTEIYLMNADGLGQTILTTGNNNRPAWSPDGSKIAFESRGLDGRHNIYLMNPNGSGQTRLTNQPADDEYPAWSPDGSKIAFVRHTPDQGSEIYVMNADGSGQTRLTNHPAFDHHPAWSPDGRKIAFARDGEIYVMNADGSGQTRLTNHLAGDWYPAWSPDGSKIAFVSNRDRNWTIYAMNADGSGQTRLTSWGRHRPAWKPDSSIEDVPDNIPQWTPRTLSPGDRVRDWVGAFDRRDFYRLIVDSPSSVTIALSGIVADADLFLYRGVRSGITVYPSGMPIRASRNPHVIHETIQVTLQPGYYFVQVVSTEERVNTDYELSIMQSTSTGNLSLQLAAALTEQERDPLCRWSTLARAVR